MRDSRGLRGRNRSRSRLRMFAGRSLGVALITGALTAASCATAMVTPAEAAAATLSVTSPDLVFIQGSTRITLASGESSARWSVADVRGHQVRSGTSAVRGGTAAIELASLGPGYYVLTATAGSGSGAATRSSSFAVLSPLPAGERDQRFGVGIHLDWEDNPNWLDDAGKVGFGGVRADIPWAAVEKSPGAYTYESWEDAAISRLHHLGITTLLIVGARNPNYDGGKTPSSPAGLRAFAKFASDAMTHYAADTSQVEVYNEFNGTWANNGACGRTPDCYLQMLRAVYSRVKADHPGATVVGPTISSPDTSWLGRLFHLGGLRSLNAVTVHDYTYPRPPEGLIDAQVSAARASISHAGGGGIPLWLDENGWSTFKSPDPAIEAKATSEADQADDVVRAEALALGNGASRYFYYDWINDGTNPADTEANFGMLRMPGAGASAGGVTTGGVTAASPKPALVTQAVLIRELGGRAYSGRDDIGAGAYSYRFGSGDGTRRMLWTASPAGQPPVIRAVSLKAAGPVTVTDEYGGRTVHWPQGGRVTLTISQHPVYVSGAVTGVAADSAPRCSCDQRIQVRSPDLG